MAQENNNEEKLIDSEKEITLNIFENYYKYLQKWIIVENWKNEGKEAIFSEKGGVHRSQKGGKSYSNIGKEYFSKLEERFKDVEYVYAFYSYKENKFITDFWNEEQNKEWMESYIRQSPYWLEMNSVDEIYLVKCKFVKY